MTATTRSIKPTKDCISLFTVLAIPVVASKWVEGGERLVSGMRHSKNCWVVLTQFWVKYEQTQPLG